MQLPSVNASSETYLDFCGYVAGAAEAWLDAEVLMGTEQQAVREVLARIGPPEERLRLVQQAREACERLVRRMRARFTVRDVILDLRVHATSNAVLDGPANRNREHPLYQRIFLSLTPSEIARSKQREEPAIVAELLKRFDETPAFDGKDPVRARLHEAVEKSEAALEALEAAEAAERRAGDEELQARLGVRGAIEQAYGVLRAAFPGQRDFIESFFPKRESASRAAGASPAAAEGSAE